MISTRWISIPRRRVTREINKSLKHNARGSSWRLSRIFWNLLGAETRFSTVFTTLSRVTRWLYGQNDFLSGGCAKKKVEVPFEENQKRSSKHSGPFTAQSPVELLKCHFKLHDTIKRINSSSQIEWATFEWSRSPFCYAIYLCIVTWFINSWEDPRFLNMWQRLDFRE